MLSRVPARTEYHLLMKFGPWLLIKSLGSIQSALPKLLKEALTDMTPPQLPNLSQELVNEGELNSK